MPTLLSSYVVSQFVIKPLSGSKLTVRYRFFYRVDRIFFCWFRQKCWTLSFYQTPFATNYCYRMWCRKYRTLVDCSASYGRHFLPDQLFEKEKPYFWYTFLFGVSTLVSLTSQFLQDSWIIHKTSSSTFFSDFTPLFHSWIKTMSIEVHLRFSSCWG